MDLAPSEEQVLLRDTVARFLADTQDATAIGRGPIAAADWRALGQLGLFAFLLPESAGGMGGGPDDVAVVAEALGRALAITPLAEGVLLCGAILSAVGSQAQTQRWLPTILTGETVLAFVRGGSAREEGGGYVLRGVSDIVRDGMDAAAFVVEAEGGEVLLVDAAAAGLIRRPIRLLDGSSAARVEFDRVAAERLAVSADDLSTAVAIAQIANVAEMVGVMTTLYEATVDYVKQRRQFGAPIGSFQVVQHRVARLFVLLEQSRSMLLRAAAGDPGTRVAAVTAARAYVSDAARRLAEDAVQLHGGMGVTDELVVGRGLRRLLLLSRLDGGGEAARAWLAAARAAGDQENRKNTSDLD